MRSTSLLLPSFLGIVVAIGGGAIACGVDGASVNASEGPVDPSSGAGAAGDSTRVSQDAAPTKSDTFRGNPLCEVTPFKCMPDDDLLRHATGTIECVQPDAGDDAGATLQTVIGCRLERVDAVVGPTCEPATVAGTDGESCTTGQDCAPGFDCVESDKGSTCRRYCCLGTCDLPSANSGATFCDVQKLVDANYKAPVCMPLKHCKLLTTGECSNTETCALVNETGDTGCVTIGDAQVDDACDDAHCAAGLTCLGQPGNRKCHQLCKVGSSTCGPNQICKTTSAFKDPSDGVCQPQP